LYSNLNNESRATFTPAEAIIIHTYNPEEEVWHYVTKLTSLSYVTDLIKERIDKKFFGLDTVNIMKIKEVDQVKS
jgi:hypothetical protein